MLTKKQFFLIVILITVIIAQIPVKASALYSIAKFQSDQAVKGTVVTEDGNTLPGVSVKLKGTSAATVTDINGKFTIKLHNVDGVLIFSYVGYKTQEVLASQATMNVVMIADSKGLSEIVVIGYGTTRKSDLTGSVSSITADELKSTPVTSFDQALQGRAAGVQVTQNSGKPGAETSIRIRGTSSINAGNEPLYVIDGMLVNSDGGNMTTGVNLGPAISPLSSINPGDIESIEILKDASSTAMYGSRGANGVVLITTKRGKAGESSVNFESYFGLQQISHKVQVLDAAQFGNFVNDAELNAGQEPVYVNPPDLGTGTDWQNALFRRAPMESYQLSFNGGDDKTKYNISAGYFNQDGIIISSNFKRYSFRVNLDRNVSSKLTVGDNITYTRVSSTGVLTNAGTIVPGVTSEALLFDPTLPIYNSSVNGGYTFQNDRGTTLGNPIADATQYTSDGTVYRFIGNFYAKYKIIDGLEFKTTFGIDEFSDSENSYGANFLERTQASQGQASVSTMQGLTWLNENTLTYNKKINNNNAFNVLAGYTLQRFNDQSLVAYAFDFPNNLTGYHDLGAALKPQPPANNEMQWSMVSYLARANYTLMNKYLFTVTGRIDGSSKFADGNKYGFFPSAAFAWRLSDEEFIKNISAISNLKLRTSYGIIGNQSIAPYQSLSLIVPYGQGVFNSASGSEVYTGEEPLSYENKNLKWETTNQLDLGLDAGFFDQRLALTVDYYDKKTNGLLLQTPIPTTTGFSSTLLNVGNIANRGFEFDLRTVNIQGAAFKWTSSFNLSLNHNEITKLNGNSSIDLLDGSILQVGQPIGTFYGYVFKGIFQTDQQAATSPVLVGQAPGGSSPAKAGDRMYADINRDGVVDANDRTILGNAQPNFTYGFGNNISYKSIDLSFFFQGSEGNKMANLNNMQLLNFTGQNNVLAQAALNRWTPTNPSNIYPRAFAGQSLDAGMFSSAYVENASYLRLKTLSLAYNFPSELINKIKVKRLRVYLTASNIWTLAKYTGYDPEANTNGQSTSIIGFDNGGYPLAKTLLIGINAGF